MERDRFNSADSFVEIVPGATPGVSKPIVYVVAIGISLRERLP
jgi:hypothetical protein